MHKSIGCAGTALLESGNRGLASFGIRMATIVMALVVPGCGAEPPAGGTGGDASETSGGDAAIRLVQEMRIDGNEADLVPIHTIAVDRRGIIAVAQRQDHAVKFFDPDGVLLGAIGRAGEGPGEFADVTRLNWVADTLAIIDASLRRVTLVDSTRTFVRTVIAPGSSRADPADPENKPSFTDALPLAWYANGSFVTYAWGAGRDGIVRVSPSGVTQQVLTVLSDVSQSIRVGGSVVSHPFPSSPRMAVSPHGDIIVIARATIDDPNREVIQLTAMTAFGDTVYSREYPFSGEPIPQSHADSVVKARTARLSPELAAAVRNAPLPRVFPPLANIFVAHGGAVWVQFRDRDAGRPYWLVDAAGEPIGEIVLNTNQTAATATTTHVWMLERDENDVQSIARYRIERR